MLSEKRHPSGLMRGVMNVDVRPRDRQKLITPVGLHRWVALPCSPLGCTVGLLYHVRRWAAPWGCFTLFPVRRWAAPLGCSAGILQRGPFSTPLHIPPDWCVQSKPAGSATGWPTRAHKPQSHSTLGGTHGVARTRGPGTAKNETRRDEEQSLICPGGW